jgi:hypothetical protein
MKKIFPVIVLLLIAAAVAAQSTYTPPTLPPLFSATDLGNSAQLMTDVNANVATYTTLLLKHDADLYSPTGSVATAIAKIAPPTPPGPAVEHMLVIPYGSTGFSITSLGVLTEYPPIQRTRRKVDFTNIRQIRSCANIISPGGAGSNFVVQQSPDVGFGTPTTISGPYDISFAALSCSPWQNYSGLPGDQFIRVEVGGSGSVTLDYISVQLR